MDLNLDFMSHEDFGLAKSFSSAPVNSISPYTNFVQKEKVDLDHELSDQVNTTGEYISEGFCFKLAPG